MRTLSRWFALLVVLAIVLPAVLLAQQTAADSAAAAIAAQAAAAGFSPFAVACLAAATLLLGLISGKLYDGFKTILPWYDHLGESVHKVMAPLWNFVFGAVATFTGSTAIGDVHSVSAPFIGGLLTAGLAAGIKRYEKSKHPADATNVVNGLTPSR